MEWKWRGKASVSNVNPDHMLGRVTVTSDRNMSGGLSRQQLEKFEKDGILIIEDFLTKDEVSSIRNVFKHDRHTVLLLCTTKCCNKRHVSCEAQRQK